MVRDAPRGQQRDSQTGGFGPLFQFEAKDLPEHGFPGKPHIQGAAQRSKPFQPFQDGHGVILILTEPDAGIKYYPILGQTGLDQPCQMFLKKGQNSSTTFP